MSNNFNNLILLLLNKNLEKRASMSYLILIDDISKTFGYLPANSEVFLTSMLKPIPEFLRLIRKIHLSSFLPFKELWMFRWDRIITKYDCVILADAGNSYNVACYIKKKFPSKRIIIWFRNSVNSSVLNPNLLDKSICEKWSFDKKDCQKYEMKFNDQVYSRNINLPNENIIYDAFFIGKDKGRINQLLDLKNNLDQQSIVSLFHIVASKGCDVKKYSYKPPVSYDQIVKYIAQSKTIIDFQAEWQEGLTWRPLEALFFKKKLITNCKKIIDYDFYNPNNIFVIGLDDINSLKNFINEDYKNIDDKYVDKYEINNWVKNFND